jgi:hypothetical protein
MSNEVFWAGIPPSVCDFHPMGVCKGDGKIRNAFIDGATAAGWANMCPSCHAIYGRGLGTGLGQRYVKQADNRFKKVMG